MQTGIDFTARCMAAEASEQINKASTGFADLDTRLDTMDTAIEQAQQAIHFKGFVNYYNDLPVNPEENDAYTVLYSGTSGTEQDGTEYVWSKHENTYEWNAWGKLTYSQAQIDNKLDHIKANQVDGMTGYAMPVATSAITTSDSLNEAVGKLEKGVDINKTNILSCKAFTDNASIDSDRKLYISATEPTGNIPTGSTWIDGKTIKSYHASANLFNTVFIQGGLDTSGSFTPTNTKRVTAYMIVSPNTTYTFSTSNEYIRLLYGYNGTTPVGIIADLSFNSPQYYSFTTAANVDRVGVSLMNNAYSSSATDILPSDVSEPMLNTGSSPEPYEPYGGTWS